MNKVISDGKKAIIYSASQNEKYDVLKNSELIVYDYKYNEGNNVEINLLGDNAKVTYHFSVINYDNNRFNLIINHLAKNTVSEVFNHGVNVEDKNLVFDITGVVPKNISGCVVNQKNQIINLKDGQSEIKPNLLIENYDVSSSHAAYIGKFKDENLFYLMSRGISKKSSIELLMKSLLLNGGNEEEFVVKEFLEKLKEI